MLQTDLTYLKKHMDIIEKKIDNMMASISNTYATKQEVDTIKKKVNKMYTDHEENQAKVSDRVWDFIKYLVVAIVAALLTWAFNGGFT